MTLFCHCDHCANSTCQVEKGACYAKYQLDKNCQVVTSYNCFNQQEEGIIKTLICDNSTTACCETNFCNKNETLLPLKEYINDATVKNCISNRNQESLIHQYLNLPLAERLVLTILPCLFIILLIGFAQRYLSRRRRNKRVLLHQQHQQPQLSVSKSSRHRHNGSQAHHHKGDDENSENSSGKINSDTAIYDTNSMASSEPLINNRNTGSSQPAVRSPLCNNLINLYNSNSLNHPQPTKGPWMSEDPSSGRPTFQMTIGSGGIQNKPETSSGSGSGQPYLTQRSIAHDIELVEVVGRGYFGVVWRGEYKGEPVAVKIFSPMAEPSWHREAEIYQTTMLRHKNILGFIATDKRDDISMTGYWLVTDYYPMGSLFDFLKTNSMSMPDAVRMAFSIANGLAHLHVEIFGTQGKPAIAHRDLKSKNILVKNDGTCCIADLGMAVRYNSNTGIVDVPSNTRLGTRRYLAPEVLDNKLNLMDFEAVKATDVYAMGLVFWEILRRTCYIQPTDQNPLAAQPEPQQKEKSTLEDSDSGSQTPTDHEKGSLKMDNEKDNSNNTSQLHTVSSTFESSTEQRNGLISYQFEKAHSYDPAIHLYDSIETSIDDLEHEFARVCEPYEAPYQGLVSIDPTVDEMLDIVCVKKMRPPVSMRWTKFAPMRDYTTLMRECWYGKPQARLSALRIRKTMGDIARYYFNLNMEYD